MTILRSTTRVTKSSQLTILKAIPKVKCLGKYLDKKQLEVKSYQIYGKLWIKET